VDGRGFSVAFDALPDSAFLERVASIRSLLILDRDGGAIAKADRYEVRIMGGELLAEAIAYGSYVRYGPVDSG
jgi:hypothetical protein